MSDGGSQNIHKNHRKRLKSTFLKDSGRGMNDVTFLEYVLFFAISLKDTNPIAHRLLERFGSFDRVLEASACELSQVEGVGENTAAFLSSLLPLFKRYENVKENNTFHIDDNRALLRLIESKYGQKEDEATGLLSFNGEGMYIGYIEIAQSDLGAANFDMRIIAEKLLKNKAIKSVIIAHNHSSGIVNPSKSDVYMTERVSAFLESLNVKLYDSVIFSCGRTYIFSRNSELWNAVCRL